MIILLIQKNWKKNEFTQKFRWMRWNIQKPPPPPPNVVYVIINQTIRSDDSIAGLKT